LLKYQGFALPTDGNAQGGDFLMSLKELQDRAADAELAEMRIRDAVARVAGYLHDQRERFFPESKPLSKAQRRIAARFFSPALLDAVRIVELTHRRLEKPPFYAEAKARGFSNLPDVTHMASVTFEDVLVFQQSPADRVLFHALVHAVQYQMLGLERYTELLVRGFVRVGSHFLVPLEAHAFALDSRFAVDGENAFSVEEDVLKWIGEGQYIVR
jgi:hypothetical protein